MSFFPNYVLNTLMFIITYDEFKETYLQIFNNLYSRNNEGTKRKKAKLSFFDGTSFDKVCTLIKKECEKWPKTGLIKKNTMKKLYLF